MQQRDEDRFADFVRARRDRRRRTLLTAGATLTAVVAVGVGATVVSGHDSAAPEPVEPGPTPVEAVTPTPATEDANQFPTSMTPEEVVNHERARLQTAAVAPGDPDTRISMWFVRCTRPCPEPGPSQFTALALTTDGYETATYVRPPFPFGLDLRMSTPVDGIFLVNDHTNGREWLVDVAGTVREVTRVESEIRPADPRLWFQCLGSWRSNWCALDPATASAYKMPRAWDGSAQSPLDVDQPWGANPEPRATSSSGLLEAWWYTESGRQLRTLAETHEGDYILDSPPGEMAYWAHPDGAESVDIYTSRSGGAEWEVDTRELAGADVYTHLKRSPDGGYLAYSTYPRLVVWRAEASGGPFRIVYEQPQGSPPQTSGAGLWTQDELVYAASNSTVAVSDDDGLNWTTIQTWR